MRYGQLRKLIEGKLPQGFEHTNLLGAVFGQHQPSEVVRFYDELFLKPFYLLLQQLGDEAKTEILQAIKVEFNAAQPCKVAAGLHDSFFITPAGQVYACGKRYGARLHPMQFDGDAKMISAQAGNNFELFLSGSGKVYAHSANAYIALAGAVQSRDKMIQMAAGADHLLMLTHDHRILVCGRNQFGQLGQAHLKNSPGLVPIAESNTDEFLQFKHIAAGYHHSLAIAKDGRVFACGHNNNGQLGVGDHDNRNCFTHVSALDNKNIVAISAGEAHSLFLTDNGSVFISGKIGHEAGLDATEVPTTPVKLTFPHRIAISQIASGIHHAIFCGKNGGVFVAGSNRNGQLGIRDCTAAFQPTLIADPMMQTDIVAASAHENSLLVSKDGRIFACGRNATGELGVAIQGQDQVFSFATRSEFAMLRRLMDDKCNEHVVTGSRVNLFGVTVVAAVAAAMVLSSDGNRPG